MILPLFTKHSPLFAQNKESPCGGVAEGAGGDVGFHDFLAGGGGGVIVVDIEGDADEVYGAGVKI